MGFDRRGLIVCGHQYATDLYVPLQILNVDIRLWLETTNSCLFVFFFTIVAVCPNCSNALTISKAPPTSRYPAGVNRFECRTCPYQYALDRTYFERKEMKRKEVADVLGGKDEWKNAESMPGTLPSLPFLL